MQLGYTILYVPDVPATRFLQQSGDYGELETSSTALAFSSHNLMQRLGNVPQAASPTAPWFEIALSAFDLAAAFDRALAARAAPMGQL